MEAQDLSCPFVEQFKSEIPNPGVGMASSEVNGVEDVEQCKQLYLKVRPLFKINSSENENCFSGDADEWIEQCCCLLVPEVAV